MKNEVSKRFYDSVSKGKNEIQVILDNEKIYFILNQKIVHEENGNGELHKKEGTLIKEHNKNYVLNGTNVELIKLFNGVILQIGKMGISIYKNFEEFLEKTVEYYSKRADIVFFCY